MSVSGINDDNIYISRYKLLDSFILKDAYRSTDA